jgi:phosphomethylpyrimidine synthase
MSEFATAFPNSEKVFVDGPQGVRVPMREVALSKGEASLRLYDTSGPQGHDVKDGLPKLREPWVAARLKPSRSGGSGALGRCVTQLHYARKGEITPEMEFIAVREGLPADFVRDEVGGPRISGARMGRAAARSSPPTSITSSSSR